MMPPSAGRMSNANSVAMMTCRRVSLDSAGIRASSRFGGSVAKILSARARGHLMAIRACRAAGNRMMDVTGAHDALTYPNESRRGRGGRLQQATRQAGKSARSGWAGNRVLGVEKCPDRLEGDHGCVAGEVGLLEHQRVQADE